MKQILTLFLLLYTGGALPSELPNTIDKIRNSIVGIGVYRPVKSINMKGPSHDYHGTGFVVGDGTTIVTNFHVLPKKLEEETNAVLAVFVGKGESARAYPATILKTDRAHDLALLKISGLSLPAMTLNTSALVREGQSVVFTGFPIGMVLGLYPVTSKGIVSAITPIVIPAVSSSSLTAEQINRLKTPFNVYQLDAIAYPGNSGSPVYLPETGVVIGVVNSVFVKNTKEAVLQSPSAIAYAIPVKYVEMLLNE